MGSMGGGGGGGGGMGGDPSKMGEDMGVALLGPTAMGKKGAPPQAPPPKPPPTSALQVQSGPELQKQFSVDPGGAGGGGSGIDPQTLQMLMQLARRGG